MIRFLILRETSAGDSLRNEPSQKTMERRKIRLRKLMTKLLSKRERKKLGIS
jgi:hypothetical protein